MKTNNKPVKISRPIKIASIVLIVLLLIGLGFIFLEKFGITNFTNQPKATEPTDNQAIIDNSPPTTEQKAAGELQKEIKSGPEVNNDLGISITSINTSNDPIQIRSVINGVISNNGNCTLELAKGDIIISKTSGTYAMPSSSTCKGFDINKSELSVGLWQIKLTVNMESKESSITDSFNLE